MTEGRRQAVVRAREVVLPWVHVWSTTMSDRLRSVHFCFSRESSCYSDETRSHMFGGLNGTVLDGFFCCYGSAGSNTRPSDVQPHALSPRFEPHEEGGRRRGWDVGGSGLWRFVGFDVRVCIWGDAAACVYEERFSATNI